MSKHNKLLWQVLRGTSDFDVSFSELCGLLRTLGFRERIRGSHHIFTKDGIEEIINIQPKGNKAKAYQIKQIRKLILKYKLGVQDNV
ncbi:MAG: type II toxin-antitoxin system HicA family toxin [bacterium]